MDQDINDAYPSISRGILRTLLQEGRREELMMVDKHPLSIYARKLHVAIGDCDPHYVALDMRWGYKIEDRLLKAKRGRGRGEPPNGEIHTVLVDAAGTVTLYHQMAVTYFIGVEEFQNN
jgi:hypothetical protein